MVLSCLRDHIVSSVGAEIEYHYIYSIQSHEFEYNSSSKAAEQNKRRYAWVVISKKVKESRIDHGIGTKYR